MTFHPQRCWKKGFTRTELIFTVGAIVLVLAVLLAAPRLRAQQKLSRCKENLKNVVLASLLWMEDNDTSRPPWRIPVDQKGTSDFEPAALRSECWFQMITFSNQLGSPKILVDPADKGIRIATTWDAKPDSGFAAPQFQDHACSYALALDYAFASSGPPLPLDGPIGTVMFVDRHLEANTAREPCSEGVTAIAFRQPFAVRWSREVHGREAGNVALVDGSVDRRTADGVKDILPVDFRTPGRSAHFLFPMRPAAAAVKAR